MKSYFKIIHTSSHSGWGSIEKRIFNESVWMAENEHKVIIIAPEESPLFIKAKQFGLKVYGVSFKFFSRIKDKKLLNDIFSVEKPDILNTHGDKDAKIALRAAKISKVPLRIHSRHINKRVRKFWSNRLIYKKFCHYIFTGGDDITRHLKKVFNLNGMQIFSIPDGVIMPNNEKLQISDELFDDTPVDDTPDGASNHTLEYTSESASECAPKYTIDTMGRDIIRIYSLHKVKLNPRTDLEYF